MTRETCPTDQDLREYAIGNCRDDLCEVIEEHLSDCPTCEDTISQFDSVDDTLMRHLPLAAADGVASPEPSPHWLDRLRQGAPQTAAEELPVTGNLPAAPTAEGLANYELLGVLGQGGMGIVYLARHKQLHRRVAIKVLSPRSLAAPEAHRRFQREIHLLGSLNHPGIVMATDAGTVTSGAYLVMEWIDGADLAQIVRERGPFAVAEACEAARQMAEALAAAHKLGAIHRDVKPSNVMIDRQQARVRLLDFGLARLGMSMQESSETSLGLLLGTLDYMAPEQAGGEPSITARADLYGLGATLFFLLTGRPPHGSHAGRSLLQRLRMIAHESAPRVRSLRVDVPEALDDFIARLLSHDPDHRPESAAEAACQLSAWAGGDLTARAADICPRPTDFHADSPEAAEAKRSMSRLLGLESAAPTAAVPVATPDGLASAQRPRRRWPWLAAAGSAAMAALLGVTFLLDTPEGTLRIESEASDVTVELVDVSDRSRNLEIDHGTNETVLRAGQYRVKLAGSHDGLSIDRDTITLRRDETTLARITRIPATTMAHTATASEWSPPANPDPQEIAEQAEADMAARRYDQALAKHVWLFEHALEYQPSLIGVRLSFWLGDWLELGQVYPPALTKLRELRDQAEVDVTRMPFREGRQSAFMDLNAINRTLEQQQRTAETFLILDRHHPEFAAEVYAVAQPALIEARMYEVCDKYIDGREDFRRIKQSFERLRAIEEKSKYPERLQTGRENRFIDATATLIGLLVVNDREDEAQEIAENARAVFDSPELRAALEKALSGNYLPPPQ